MPLRFLASVLAIVLVLAYVLPLLWKMKDPALTVVILIGIVVMLADQWQTLRDARD